VLVFFEFNYQFRINIHAMKTKILTLLALAGFATAHAQAPNGFSYQAAMRNASGQPLASQSVSLRFTLREGSTIGTIIYRETQLKTTTAQGMLMATVGAGSVAQGAFPTAAQWSSGAKFLQVEADATGGSNFAEISNTQLMAVPYASFANTSNSATSANTANALAPTATVAPSQITGGGALAGQTLKWNGTAWAPASGGASTVPLTQLEQGGATTGQIIKWNGTSWAPANDGPATITMSQIEQAGATSGQIIKWNGTGWAPANDGPATITASQISQSGATTGQVLKWNGTAWVPAKDSAGTAGTTLTAGTGLSITGNVINSRWTSAGNDLYNNNSGNVGIGNTTPLYPLSIHSSNGNGEIEAKTGSSTAYAGLRLTNSSSTTMNLNKYGTGATGNSNGLPNASLGYLNNSASGSLLLSTADSIAFATNGSQRLRVLKSGEVNVGSGLANARFNVSGSGSSLYIPAPSDYDYSLAAYAVPDTVTTSFVNSVGVLGFAKGSSFFNAGIGAVAGNSGTFNVGAIFEAKALQTTGKRNYGIYAETDGGYAFTIGHYNGVFATSTSASGTYGTYSAVTGTAGSAAYAGYFSNTSTNSSYTNYGVYGTATSGLTNYAGYFGGNVYVSGTLSKAGGTFQIDHPQDPENKYLIHSFVESPEMMNIYNGNITTDANGVAEVTLPSYFQSLNVDFRYQLTVIGPDFAQAVVSKKIEGNKFSIKTDKPNTEVSWQVTGVRNDAWAKANRVIPEKPKEANAVGKYLHPELFGKPASAGIHYVNTEGIAVPRRNNRNK
jgi:hypothetical protein